MRKTAIQLGSLSRQVLHGLTAPEAPCFLPELPVPDPQGQRPLDETGCRPIPRPSGVYGTPLPLDFADINQQAPMVAEEAVTSALASGFFGPLDAPSHSPPWRASVRDYLQAYGSGQLEPVGGRFGWYADLKAGCPSLLC